MTSVYLLIGGNIGNRLENLTLSADLIQELCGKIVQKSAIYETAAWGVTDQPDFLNQVIEIETRLNAKELLVQTQQIELDLGRTRHQRWHERTMDIDILYFGHEVIQTEMLKIPHPQLQNRRFTLIPLIEIAPNFNHPVLNLQNQELLLNCSDELEVRLFSP